MNFLRIFLVATALSTAAAEPRAVLVVGRPAPDQPPVGGELREPFAIDRAADGTFYICELGGGRVHKLTPDGQFSTIAGVSKKGNQGDGGPAKDAVFNGMHHLTVAPDGGVLIADTWNNRVRRLDPKAGTIDAHYGTGKKAHSGDGGPARQADIGGIYSIALATDGSKLYITDLDNRRIRVVDTKTGTISTLAGNGKKGVPKDGELAKDSPLVDPRAVTCDAAGNVYILERGGHALRLVTPDGRIRTVAGTGKAGRPVADVPALEATFNGPKHLCCDREGNVIIADAENHVIRKYTPKDGRVVVIAGTGKKGHAGVGGPATKVQLARPHGVYVDPDGVLYVVDSYNERILKLVP